MTSVHPLDRLRVGMRAVVRHRLDDGLSDALGEVVALDDTSVSVATRRGVRVVPRGAVVAAKEVPPAPSRRGAPHLAPSMGDLQRVMVEGWPPTERAALGGWMLRAAGGFTGRANSVLPLGDPGLPLPEAVLAAERWYAERQLRPLFSLYGPEGFAVGDDALGTLLTGRGYTDVNRSVVMTASVRALQSAALPTSPPAVGAAEVTIHAEATPSPAWWAASDERRRSHRGTAEAIMAGSPRPGVPLAGAGRAGRGHRARRVRPRLGRRLRRARRARLAAARAGHRPRSAPPRRTQERAASRRRTCRWRRRTRPPAGSTAAWAAPRTTSTSISPRRRARSRRRAGRSAGAAHVVLGDVVRAELRGADLPAVLAEDAGHRHVEADVG